MASLALTPIKFRKTTSSSPLVPPKPTPMASLALTPIKFRKTTSSSPLVPPKPHQSSGSIHLPFLPRSASTFPHQLRLRAPINASSSSAPTGSSPGLYSSQTFELIAQNVDFVLEDVRPYLISDGGNVDVVTVEDGVVSLRLQGACESCPSSITTMQMGIERVLKEKFGDALKEIRQVYEDEVRETNAEAVNRHLDILRPAIANYGGSVEVLSVEGGECLVRYVGPESIGSGIKAAIKEKFPDIVNVALTC